VHILSTANEALAKVCSAQRSWAERLQVLWTCVRGSDDDGDCASANGGGPAPPPTAYAAYTTVWRQIYHIGLGQSLEWLCPSVLTWHAARCGLEGSVCAWMGFRVEGLESALDPETFEV
jgi:hypothetical protein